MKNLDVNSMGLSVRASLYETWLHVKRSVLLSVALVCKGVVKKGIGMAQICSEWASARLWAL